MSLCRLGIVTIIAAGIGFSHPTALAQSDPVFELAQCGKLPVPTQMHGSVVVGDRFYIFGGDSTQGWTNAVHSARITPEAQLAGWRRETDMPERRAYLVNAVEAVNDRIYLVGGAVAETSQTDETKITRSRDVLWTHIGPDGQISEWKKSDPFPGQPLSLLAACSDDHHLYVTGGSSGNEMSDAIDVCDFTSDGAPANWRVLGKLAKPLRFHGAAILNGRIYVWGGQHSRNAVDASEEVFSAPMHDADIGAWRAEAQMPAAVYSSSSCGFNDYVISVGGRYVNGYPTNGLWFSQLGSDGALVPWRALKTNLDTRVYHALGLDKTRGLVFISGGKNKTTPDLASGNILDNVAIFRLAQNSDKAVKAVTASTEPDTYPTLEAAASASAKFGKPVLAFLYAPEVPDCRRAWDNIIQTPKFKALQQKFAFALIDASNSAGIEAMRRLSIFRVPALVRLGADGQVVRKTTGLKTWADVEALLSANPS